MTISHNRVIALLATALFCASIFLVVLFSKNAYALLFTARIDWTTPNVASQYTESITIRGSGWGPYDERGEPRAFLVSVDEDAKEIPLTIERNYRDCSFVAIDSIRGSCVMDKGDMLLRVSFPKNVKEGNYLVSVSTTAGIEAVGEMRVVRLPSFNGAKRPIMAIMPSSGSVGAPVLFTAGGFAKRTGLFIRFDGVMLRGVFYTDENGFIDEAEFTVPKNITKNFKAIAITPGKHTVELNDGAGTFQTVTFTVMEKDEKPKKEDEPRKEKPKKEEEPKTGDKPFAGRMCDANLPRVWQEGCISPADQQKEQKPQVELYAPYISGKPCKNELAITFQPGCIAQERAEPEKPFAGKLCDANLPRVWQEGCIDSNIKTGTVPEGKKYCEPNIPSYNQPGCVPQEQGKIEQESPFLGKPCDTNLPRLWQTGCVNNVSTQQ